jgi:tetratricopeptide (TPR) repeat protein
MYENRMGDYTSALEHSRNSISANPFCFKAWEELGRCMVHLPRGLYERISGGIMEDLLCYYLKGTWELETMTRPLPKPLDSLRFVQLQKALIHYILREYHEAESIFSELHQNDQDSLSGLDCYSDILFLDGRKGDLQELMIRAETINANHPITCHISGNYYAMNRKHEEAAVYFRKAVRLDPERGAAWILAAQQFLEMRRPEASIDCYLHATGKIGLMLLYILEINPQDFKGWFGLGQVYELLESYTFALEHYSRAAHLVPSDYRIHWALGNCFSLRGQHERALGAFERSISCPGAPMDVHLQIGATLNKMKQSQEAIQHFRCYLETNPALIHSPTSIDDPILRSAIISVAQDDQAKGDHLKATLWFSLLSRSHGVEAVKANVMAQNPVI